MIAARARRIAVAAVLLLASAGGLALPRHAAVPGGVAVIRLGHAAEAPQAFFRDRRVAVLRDGDAWVALVGLALDLEPGSHPLRIAHGGRAERVVAVEVGRLDYPVQHLRIPDPRKVEPLPEDRIRIAGEQKRIDEIKAHWRDVAMPDAAFRLPAPGRVSGNFGLRRIINGQPRNPHAGIDIAAPVGTPVRAAGAGVVLETADFFFNGNAIYVDHGQGLVTLYCHLDRIEVRPGEHVVAGQRIGLTGNTGRSSGPHLHWTVLANGAAVDPRLFLSAPAAASPRRTR